MTSRRMLDKNLTNYLAEKVGWRSTLMRYTVPFVSAWLVVALFDVSISSQASNATPPGADACVALASGKAAGLATLSSSYDSGSDTQPAHCVVRGSAAPRTGADGKAYETRFELRLPTTWSGRFLYQGGGGNDGMVAPAVGRNTGSFPETGLQRGFAVVTTDAGHQGATPEFGLDPIARVDHAYAAHDRTATIAFTIVARYYGRAPDRKYFVGCSGGGRQGMMFAQRYPAYFDGIVICAPAMSVSSGATIAAAWDTQTFLSVAPTNADGQRVLSQAFSDADLALVARGITAACDAADGATDGTVLRPDACRFDPKRLQCAGAKDANCLTSAQVGAIERAFGGPRDSSGRALYVGQAWDPGIAAPGWRQWKLGSSQTGTPNAANATLDGRRARTRILHAPRSGVCHQPVQLRSRSCTDGGVFLGLRHASRRDPGRVPHARWQAADFPRDRRSDLLGARVDRLLPASHPQQWRARVHRQRGPGCSSCLA